LARKPADQSVSRDDILRAAAEVLKQRGYEATTMKDIAAEVHLTAASLYHHFKNKNALMLAVLEGGMDYALQQIRPIAESDLAPPEKLRAMIAVHVVSLTEYTSVGAAMVFEIGALLGIKEPGVGSKLSKKAIQEFADRRETFITRRVMFEGYFRQAIREGIACNAFREVDVAIFTKTMLGAHNWVGVWYRPGGRLDGAQIADQMADTFLRALAP
jgi:AcrR family transcriptional regulator